MLTPFSSQLIADTGISTGDEGKAIVILEIVNELRERTNRQDAVAAVMKVNGGSNSGHTVAGLKLNLCQAVLLTHTYSSPANRCRCRCRPAKVHLGMCLCLRAWS